MNACVVGNCAGRPAPTARWIPQEEEAAADEGLVGASASCAPAPAATPPGSSMQAGRGGGTAAVNGAPKRDAELLHDVIRGDTGGGARSNAAGSMTRSDSAVSSAVGSDVVAATTATAVNAFVAGVTPAATTFAAAASSAAAAATAGPMSMAPPPTQPSVVEAARQPSQAPPSNLPCCVYTDERGRLMAQCGFGFATFLQQQQQYQGVPPAAPNAFTADLAAQLRHHDGGKLWSRALSACGHLLGGAAAVSATQPAPAAAAAAATAQQEVMGTHYGPADADCVATMLQVQQLLLAADEDVLRAEIERLETALASGASERR